MGTTETGYALRAYATPIHTEGEERVLMATDYDTRRRAEEEVSEDSIEELKTRRVDNSAAPEEDEADFAEPIDLPGADLSHEELSIRVLPRQADEFTCARCFLVHHRSQLASEKDGQMMCRDCMA